MAGESPELYQNGGVEPGCLVREENVTGHKERLRF